MNGDYDNDNDAAADDKIIIIIIPAGLLCRFNTMEIERHARDAFQYTTKRTVYKTAEPRHKEKAEEEEQKKRKMVIKLMVMKCKVSSRTLASSG
jgi:hypothetical protein